MSEMMRIGWSYYKLVIFKGLNGYFIVVATALCASNVFIPRVNTIILALVAGSKFIEGLLNQDLSNAQKSQVAGDTSRFYNPITQTTEIPKQVETKQETKFQ